MADINFSIVIAARENAHWTKRCVQQFINKAQYPDKNEIILMIDYDDHDNIDILKDPVFDTYNIHTIVRRQSGKLNPFSMTDYYMNYGAAYSSGKFIWCVNSECEPATENWDGILLNNIETYLQDKPDRIVYIVIDDDTHTGSYVKENASSQKLMWKPDDTKLKRFGCCFPICSRESYNALGIMFPKEIAFWGADTALYQIFSALPINRILFLTQVKLLHESIHNGKISVADGHNTHERCNKLSVITSLTEEQKYIYINRLYFNICKLQSAR